MSRMTLADFESELMSEGFDGFPSATRKRYINWGYRRVAKRSPWYWEKTKFTWNPTGPSSIPLDLDTNIPTWRSIAEIFGVTTNYRRKLRIMSSERFLKTWLPLDLTLSANASEPSWYYVWAKKLYILPPPLTARSYDIYFFQRPAELALSTDTPLTPEHLDEGILLAATIPCHRRAKEIDLALEAERELAQFFDDMLSDESYVMTEETERFLRDDTWL